MASVVLKLQPVASNLDLILLSKHLKLEYSKPDNDRNVLCIDGQDLSSDDNFSACRLLCLVTGSDLYGKTALERAHINHWVDFAAQNLQSDSSVKDAIWILNDALEPVAYLVGYRPTIADFVVWKALHSSSWIQNQIAEEIVPLHIGRYYRFLSEQPLFREASHEVVESCSTVNQSPSAQPPLKPVSSGLISWKEQGKFIDLPGAEMGKVVVRFPPEASGYLHIGHAKAALLNQYYQESFKGKLIMRFDDTNPAKENAEFEKVILEDIKLLGLKPDVFSHTSDHFDKLIDMCERMLREAKAYVDDTDPETMKKEREQRVESKCRSNSVEENVRIWNEMKKGSDTGLKYCVRVKIDMAADNGCMRDPTIYRCKPEQHVRTGNKYKVYPTYDFACPIVDSLEGVTHALRTTEYHDRDEQYYWILDALALRKPHIYEYSRLNLQNTVLSKRKLTWFVDEKIVDGWDDPRFPTVRGVLRRGMTVEGLKQFIIAQGSSRAVNMMEWDKIWAVNKKVIDPVVPRYTALLRGDVIVVNVEGATVSSQTVPCHPKDPAVGTKVIWYSPTVMIDVADASSIVDGETVTFINWGNLQVIKVHRDASGKPTSIDARLNLENTNYKKTQKLTWLADGVPESFPVPTVCLQYEHIISKAIVGKDEDFKLFVNRNSKNVVNMLGDPELAKLKRGDIIQLQRRGFYICDKPYTPSSKESPLPQPCVLISVPDGHQKEMPTSGSKHKLAQTPSEKSTGKNQKKKTDTVKKDSETVPKASGDFSLSDEAKKLDELITSQGNKIRQLKSEKADKESITKEVNVLKDLKAQFKVVSGVEWKPKTEPSSEKTVKFTAGKSEKTKPTTPVAAIAGAKQMEVDDKTCSEAAVALKGQIDAQGDRIRQLKSTKDFDQATLSKEVENLLSLKSQYKDLTGVDLQVGSGKSTKKDKKKGKEKKSGTGAGDVGSKAKPKVTDAAKKEDASREIKHQTRLGLEVSKSENLSEWYSQIITKAEMIEYYDISGCYILRPWAFSIWEKVQRFFDDEIKKLGVENVYFPMFVSQAALEREKTHIADFAPEVAWVTKSGQSDLAEPIAIRPTSETVMYPSYAKWIKSHRDLPLKLNQWNNIVRWEFKHPQPFIRTREFLWQEGHSAFATREEAVEEVYTILELYRRIYEELLAIPVILGKKTEKEKFAGGDFTTTAEAYISATGRGIQGATSHHLGQNFSKMFEIVFEDAETQEKCFVHQNSWGITTRTIGVMCLVHGDDSGLVLPPKVASVQVIIVPCGITASLSDCDRQSLLIECQQLRDVLCDAGIRARCDLRDNYSPGWKFNHWELKGVPLRLELGPRDLKQSQMVLVRRDTGARQSTPLADVTGSVDTVLKEIQSSLFNKAKVELDANISVVQNFSDFCAALDKKHIIMAPFCCGGDCEDAIKRDSARDAVVEEGAPSMGAKSLCIPFKQPAEITDDTKCVHPKCSQKPVCYCLFGRSY